MSLEKILERIISDAEKEAADILSAAERRAAEIIEEARRKAEATRREAMRRAEAAAGERKNRIVTIAALDARKSILAAKREGIEDAFREAIDRFGKLDDRRYKAFFEKMLSSRDIPKEGLVYIGPEDRKRITQDFISKIGEGLKLAEETRDIKGGFILVTADAEINNSLEARLKSIRDTLEVEVAQTLFPDSQGGE
ncbi:MAG: V-type ATP synthase subunit E [bacterium]